MAIEFQCPDCKAAVRVPDIHAGKKACCPACKQQIRIPDATPVADAPVAAPPVSIEKPATPPVEPAEAVKPAVDPVPTVVAKPATPATGEPVAPAPTPEPTAAAAASAAKSGYIKFTCPGCGKMTGFEAKFAGKVVPCPSCKVKVMIPEESGGDSFLVGTVPGATEKPGMRKGAAAEHVHAAHKPLKKKTAESRSPLLGIVAGIAVVGLIITAAVYWPRKVPVSGAQQTVAALSTSPAIRPPAGAQSPSDGAAGSSADTKSADADTMEIGVRADAPAESATSPAVSQTAEPKAPPSISDMLSTHEKKSVRTDEETDRGPALKHGDTTPADANIGKELIASAQADPEPAKPAAHTTPSPKPIGSPLPQNSRKPAPAPAVPAAPIAAGPSVCLQCLGMNTVPILPPHAYVHAASDPLNAAAAVPWKYCPKCQAGKDPQALVTAETDRLSTVIANNQHWEQLTHARLAYLETHHVAIRSTMPESEVRNVGTALEQLTGQLEQLTQTTVMTQTRPDTDELFIAWDIQGYSAILKAMMQQDPEHDWQLGQNSGGCLLPHRGMFNANRGLGVSPKHMALYQLGELLILQATDNKAPTWLRYGFASYCENLVAKKNLVYAFQYEKNDVRFSDNWDAEIRKNANQGKLKPWDQAFLIQPIGMTSLDYLTCYSMVDFMMSTDPKLFPKYCLAIKDGLDSEKAFEKVYNSDIKKIQQMWSNWAVAH